MPEDRIKVGFIGCGGIARSLYTGIYAALPEIAQVVAVADLVDDLAENRRQVLKEHKVELIEHLGHDEPPNRSHRLFRGEAAGDAGQAALRAQGRGSVLAEVPLGPVGDGCATMH